MDHTVVYEKHKRFIVIPEDYILNWIQKFTQEQIDTKDSALYTVRTLQKIYDDGLLIMSDEINLSKENPEQNKLKQWIES